MIYVVKKGDTIFKIAREYGVTPTRIEIINGLNPNTPLVIGQALLILRPQITHRVSRGDTVFSIAQSYGITEIELLQRNPTLIGRTLYEGETLVIEYEEQASTEGDFNGYAYPYINLNTLSRALVCLSELTIFGYGFNMDGSLITINDEPLLASAKFYKARPILLLSSITGTGNFSSENASKLFNDVALQNKVLANIITTMQAKGYTGLDIDFEFIKPEDKDAFVGFIENAVLQLRPYGFTVNVDLAPKTSADQKGLLYEAHDYRAIGEIADTVLIMTYEWGYTFGPPMAVAPLPNVRQVAEYALTEIPKEKITLGIPNYGYDWPLPFEKGVTMAETIGNEEAVMRALRSGAEIKFDETAMAPYFEYRNHIVYFEDVRSIKAKLDLIKELQLRGGGYWNIMRRFPANWSLLSNEFFIKKYIE